MTITKQLIELYSTLGGDPDLGDLVSMFVEEMPDRIATLEQAIVCRDWENLQRMAHQLKGAAGSYGFHQLTPFAAAVESSVRDNAPDEKIRSALQNLIEMCRQVRAGAAT